MKNLKALRVKYNKCWVCIYLRKIDNYINISMVVSKSMRAANDWENNRRNRRARRINSREARKVNFVGLYKAYKLLKNYISTLPPGTILTTLHHNERTVLLSLFLKRLGFDYYPQGDLAVFVLITRSSKEAQLDCEHTTS